MKKLHEYQTLVNWTGNLGEGTTSYKSYARSHELHVAGKPIVSLSSDPSFRGEPQKHNPEELFLASISSCHMLWYLHLCADSGIVVLAYSDEAKGLMQENEDGSGRFIHVQLNPKVIVSSGCNKELANSLHHKAHEFCFISNSLNFEVTINPIIE